MKKTMVKSSDYELYKVPLPWKILLRNDRNSFIVSELEKRHPRFSGNCCYDTRYVVDRHNLIADIVVMDKSSLAEYRNCGGELFLEKEKNRNVFSGKSKIIRALTIFLILLAGILSFRIVISLLEDEAAIVELVSENDSNDVAEETFAEENPLEKLVGEVFSSVSARGGKISSFSFSRRNTANERIGQCKFSIFGCNSEDVANARYCAVSFKNNEPHFDLVLPFTEKIRSENPSEKTIRISQGQNPDFEAEDLGLSSLRNRLRALGAVIESEHDEPECAEINFFTPLSQMYSCLKTCAAESEDLGWSEKNLLVSVNGGMGKISLSFEKNQCEKESGVLMMCAQYAYLFSSEPKSDLKIVPKKTRLFATLNRQSGGGESEDALKESKIGEIRRKDGSVLICVRNDKGRIAYMKKEAVNAN